MKTFYVRERASGSRISCAQEVWEENRAIGWADQETAWIIGYNGKNREIYRECLFMGGAGASIVDPSIVFKRLLVKDCRSFILLHNHPSDDPDPSNSDREITRRLLKGAEILGIKFLDHIIICEQGFYSFQEHGGLTD